jgi:hypothetical protein
MELENKLFKTTPEQYGAEFNAHLLEQYKMYVEMADRISIRRQSANNYFSSINTAVLAFLGVTSKNGFDILPKFWPIIVSVAGLILCYTWYRLVRSYKDLNTGKFMVIHELEKKLPASPYDAEWLAVGEGKNSKLYLPFTHIEIRIPWIFMLLYIAVIINSVYYLLTLPKPASC